MINFPSFLLGAVSGIYVAQSYDIPSIKQYGDKFVDYLKSIEKKDD
tara:strand:+ start:278 stop:415 length:138 start_codon:yes stop_codon:yes gene_type:complete